MILLSLMVALREYLYTRGVLALVQSILIRVHYQLTSLLTLHFPPMQRILLLAIILLLMSQPIRLLLGLALEQNTQIRVRYPEEQLMK